VGPRAGLEDVEKGKLTLPGLEHRHLRRAAHSQSLYRLCHPGSCSICRSNSKLGRAIAQAVSRWLPTAAARGSRPGRACGVCGGQSGTGEGFLWQSSFHQFLHHHNHPGLAQRAYWWPQCRVDPIGLHHPLFKLKKKKKKTTQN
jgi:hypothetical protein